MPAIPEVIYDRFLPRNSGDWETLEEIHDRLMDSGHAVTNPLGLTMLLRNKGAFHRFLFEQGLPTIMPCQLSDLSVNGLDQLLAEAEAIYVKPIGGAKGASIGVLEKSGGDLIFHEGTGLHRHQFLDTASALSWLKVRFEPGRTIVMRSSRCSRLFERSFDIRVLVQNTGLDKYAITGMAARVGPKGAWVSNLAAGGKAMTVDKLVEQLRSNYDGLPSQLIEDITSLSLACSFLLHKQFGTYTEVAYDFVLDTVAEPLFLEANSKPARWIFTQLADAHSQSVALAAEFREMRRRSVYAPLEHALFLLEELSRNGGSG